MVHCSGRRDTGCLPLPRGIIAEWNKTRRKKQPQFFFCILCFERLLKRSQFHNSGDAHPFPLFSLSHFIILKLICSSPKPDAHANSAQRVFLSLNNSDSWFLFCICRSFRISDSSLFSFEYPVNVSCFCEQTRNINLHTIFNHGKVIYSSM